MNPMGIEKVGTVEFLRIGMEFQRNKENTSSKDGYRNHLALDLIEQTMIMRIQPKTEVREGG